MAKVSKAPAPAPVAEAVSTKPEAEATPKPKKAGKRKPVFLVNGAEPSGITTLPEGYTIGVHRPLKRKQFAGVADFLEYRAAIADAQAAHFRALAAEERAAGSSEQRKAAKRLLAITRQMDALKAQLAAAGVDVASLLNSGDVTVA